MMSKAVLLGLSGLAAMLAASAGAQQPPPRVHRAEEQRRVRDQVKAGRILPLPEIERHVIPQMAGWQYIGVDFDAERGVYTLKFLREGTVLWVDVDGHSAAIVGRSGGQ